MIAILALAVLAAYVVALLAGRYPGERALLRILGARTVRAARSIGGASPRAPCSSSAASAPRERSRRPRGPPVRLVA